MASTAPVTSPENNSAPTPTVTADAPTPAQEVVTNVATEEKPVDAPTEPEPAQAPTPEVPASASEPTATPATEADSVTTAAAAQPAAEPSKPLAESEPTPAHEATSVHTSIEPTPAAVPPAAAPEATTAANVPEPTAAPSSTEVETAAPEPIKAETKAAEGKETKKVEFTEVEEPQNPLTERFTAAEWKALKEFRRTLSDIFESAYEDPKAAEKPIKLWGIEISPREAEAPKDARVSVLLMKFLRARNLHVPSAKDMMIATLRWREQFNVEAALQEKFPEDIFGQLGHLYGKDKEGRPVVYNLYGANKDLKAVFGDVQRFLRWRVKLMEESIALLDFQTIDQTVQIHDYEGVSLTSRDANSKQAANEASSIFQNHYPEFLHRKFFINVPSLLNWIFWLFKPLISANTLAKMSVVGTGTHAIKKALLPVISADQLPKRYGGEAEAF